MDSARVASDRLREAARRRSNLSPDGISVIGCRVPLCVHQQEQEHLVNLRFRTARWIPCLLLTGLFMSPGCNDPQYGTVSVKPKASDSGSAPVKPMTRKDLPKNQYRLEDQKSDKLRRE
jgi:hypothetical protein